MLIIVLLSLLSLTVFKLRKKISETIFPFLMIGTVTWLLIESATYCFFIYTAYQGDGLFLIGRQSFLDLIYRARLVRAHYLVQHRKNQFWTLDSTMGYTIGINKSFQMLSSNSSATRGPREYSLLKPRNRVRIATVGASFVFGDNEADQHTWQYFIENHLEDVEVMNFGVSGYNFSQSVLRLGKDALRFNPDIVVMGLKFSAGYMVDPLLFANENLRRTENYQSILRLENGNLLADPVYLDNFFNLEWQKLKLYDPISQKMNSGFLAPNLWDLSNVIIWTKYKKLRLLAEEYRNAFLSKSKNQEFLPNVIEVHRAVIEYITSLAKNRNFVLIFTYPRPEQFDFYPIESDLIKYIDMEEKFEKSLEKLGADKKEYLNHGGHYNSMGNQLYGQIFVDYLLSKKWKIEGKYLKFNRKL